jgi:hypothetical protein
MVFARAAPPTAATAIVITANNMITRLTVRPPLGDEKLPLLALRSSNKSIVIPPAGLHIPQMGDF